MDFQKAYHLISEKFLIWSRELIRMLPNLALAALVLVLGIYLSKIIKKVAGAFIKKFVKQPVINTLFASFTHILSIGITIFIVLSILNLDKAVTSLLAGAGIIGLALAFAFQDIAANFVAGIVMSFTRPIELGDLVKVKDYMGKVESIRLRDSVIRTFQGQLIFIPNKEIFQNPIENFSKLKRRRVDMVIGVSYGDDLEKVKSVALAAVKDVKMQLDGFPPQLYFEEFADSSINFSLRIWLNSVEQPDYLEAKSQAIMAIKNAFNKNEISIPYPIRTLDFAIKGGEKLSEQIISFKSSEIKNNND